MLNHITLMGRLTRDPELRYTSSGTPVATFSLAVDRDFAQKGEGPEGTLELVLSGNASIALDVECVEVQLADTGGAWETSLKPRHPAV